MLAAEKGAEKIAVEIKSFVSSNDLEDLYQALGQFVLYRKALQAAYPGRVLYLALSEGIYREMFADEEGESLQREERIRLLVFNPPIEEIVLWKQ